MDFQKKWEIFWVRRSGMNRPGRCAAWLASLFAPAYKGKTYLAHLTEKFFISHRAQLNHSQLFPANNVFIGDRVTIFQARDGGPVTLGKNTHIHQDVIVETGAGGELSVGENSHVQPRCQFNAYKGSITVGSHVQIGPGCAFYSYNHGTAPDKKMTNQPITSRGDIVIEDDVWLGYGVIVLDGVHIGRGAVVGAGSVVTANVDENMIVAGVPAKVLKKRE